MPLLWIVLIAIAAVIAALTLYDIFRHHLGAWRTAAWCLVVVVLPVIGSIIWWATRKPLAGEVGAAYAAQADVRAHNERLPVDRGGLPTDRAGH